MHLQQTKAGSLATGGPQYYFHSVAQHVKEFLRKHGSCPVVLQTPYGIAGSSFTAVGRDHKISKTWKIVAGGVGHDRIQGKESIGKDETEKIKNAAIRLTNGSVFTGFSHGDALEKARAVHAEMSESHFAELFTKSKDGFLTNKGHFVGRNEAYRIAVKSRQITPKTYADACQDLWEQRPVGNDRLGALAFNNARIDKREN